MQFLNFVFYLNFDFEFEFNSIYILDSIFYVCFRHLLVLALVTHITSWLEDGHYSK